MQHSKQYCPVIPGQALLQIGLQMRQVFTARKLPSCQLLSAPRTHGCESSDQGGRWVPFSAFTQADVTGEAPCQPGGAVSHIMQANGTPHVNNSIMTLPLAHLPLN